MSDPTACRPLAEFGALRFQGPDARKFLQGQLSNDMARLRAGVILRAGVHNPQGRTIALLWLAEQSSEDVLAMLPLELVAPVAAHLRRYLLRAKLTISDVSGVTQIYGLRTHERGPGYWSFDTQRALLINAGAPPTGCESLSRDQWRQLDIALGEPQVYASTSGQFVAQMLNLDCVDAVSFDKGCYTGQEVIARAHFRGRVKRRMQRFETLTGHSPKEGYGLTETAPLGTLQIATRGTRPGVKPLRGRLVAFSGKSDSDRLHLHCLP